MSHRFTIERLPNNVTLMVCKCGLTYRYSGTESWYEVPFRNAQGVGVDPPAGRCGTDGEAEQQEKDETAQHCKSGMSS